MIWRKTNLSKAFCILDVICFWAPKSDVCHCIRYFSIHVIKCPVSSFLLTGYVCVHGTGEHSEPQRPRIMVFIGHVASPAVCRTNTLYDELHGRPLQVKCWKRRHAPSGHSIRSRQKAWLALSPFREHSAMCKYALLSNSRTSLNFCLIQNLVHASHRNLPCPPGTLSSSVHS